MFASWYCEESYYCINVGNGEQCVDCYRVFNSQHIYEWLDCENCNNCHYIQRCKDCADVYISLDCDNCKHCIGCKNLKNKEYYVFNQAVTQEQFEKIKKDFTHDEQKRVEIFEKAKQVKYEYPSKCLTLIQCENTQNSNQCFNSENVSNSFDIANCRDVKYTYEMLLWWANDCYDYDIWWENASLMYEVHCSGNAHQILFCNVVWGGNKVFYCDNCLVEVRDCFGCIGLHENEQYCILNKQYTKESYEKTVAQIIKHMQKTGEWGEFFPSSLSPFGYNETHAQEYYPITGPQPNLLPKGEGVKGIIKDNQFIPLPLGALEWGISLLPLGEAGWGIFNWSNYEIPFPKVEKIIPANKLPHDIHQIPDDILNWAIECEVSKKPFRIIQQELEFYKTHALPLPKRSPEQRYRDRFILREPRKVFSRKCDKCSIEIQTTIATTRPEKVYCAGCYDKEIY